LLGSDKAGVGVGPGGSLEIRRRLRRCRQDAARGRPAAPPGLLAVVRAQSELLPVAALSVPLDSDFLEPPSEDESEPELESPEEESPSLPEVAFVLLL